MMEHVNPGGSMYHKSRRSRILEVLQSELPGVPWGHDCGAKSCKTTIQVQKAYSELAEKIDDLLGPVPHESK